MPLRIRWAQKEYFYIALTLLGSCGLFQVAFIFIAQYFLSIGNYITIILIPLGVSLVLFYASTIIFNSYAQVKQRKKIKSQYLKGVFRKVGFKRMFQSNLSKSLLIIFIVFTPFFFASYFISRVWLNNIYSFIIAENISAIICVFVANIIEKRYGRIQRF